MSSAIQTTEPAAPLCEPHSSRSDISTPARSAADSVPWLPCTLALDLPVMHFTVRDLLELRAGKLVETACHQSSDIPLRVNGLLMGWTEFEVIGERLAARITDLA